MDRQRRSRFSFIKFLLIKVEKKTQNRYCTFTRCSLLQYCVPGNGPNSTQHTSTFAWGAGSHLAGKQQYMSEPEGKPVETQERSEKKNHCMARRSESLPLPFNSSQSESVFHLDFLFFFCLDFIKGDVVLHTALNTALFTKGAVAVTLYMMCVMQWQGRKIN